MVVLRIGASQGDCEVSGLVSRTTALLHAGYEDGYGRPITPNPEWLLLTQLYRQPGISAVRNLQDTG